MSGDHASRPFARHVGICHPLTCFCTTWGYQAAFCDSDAPFDSYHDETVISFRYRNVLSSHFEVRISFPALVVVDAGWLKSYVPFSADVSRPSVFFLPSLKNHVPLYYSQDAVTKYPKIRGAKAQPIMGICFCLMVRTPSQAVESLNPPSQGCKALAPEATWGPVRLSVRNAVFCTRSVGNGAARPCRLLGEHTRRACDPSRHGVDAWASDWDALSRRFACIWLDGWMERAARCTGLMQANSGRDVDRLRLWF
ncbi:hypothetical protein C8Q80DRAFT_97638 [Daedaleopsis nitida]|nr:hypothetical protein C8Q80DRAFT_97638 [Daedaleopsis nitida]